MTLHTCFIDSRSCSRRLLTAAAAELLALSTKTLEEDLRKLELVLAKLLLAMAVDQTLTEPSFEIADEALCGRVYFTRGKYSICQVLNLIQPIETHLLPAIMEMYNL